MTRQQGIIAAVVGTDARKMTKTEGDQDHADAVLMTARYMMVLADRPAMVPRSTGPNRTDVTRLPDLPSLTGLGKGVGKWVPAEDTAMVVSHGVLTVAEGHKRSRRLGGKENFRPTDETVFPP